MKINNEQIEVLASKDINKLIKKDCTAKTAYWIARIFDKLESESKHYFTQKQRLIDKYAKRDDTDEIIRDGDNISIGDIAAFRVELEELLKIEIDLGFDMIKFDLDKEPNFTPEEMQILLPFIEV